MLARAVENVVDEKSDEVIITLFQSGDKDVFRILVERYQDKVRNLIYSIFHEPSILDDLSQEVFLKVYEALPNFRFESSFYTWLYRITVNRSRDELRKRKVRRFFPFQSLDESSSKEVEDKTRVEPHSSEVHDLITNGLKALPEKFRIPIILKDIDGMSYEEIAEIMECEIGTVKSRLSRGRTMLRNVLRPLLEE